MKFQNLILFEFFNERTIITLLHARYTEKIKVKLKLYDKELHLNK